jgi:hypothetical protein
VSGRRIEPRGDRRRGEEAGGRAAGQKFVHGWLASARMAATPHPAWPSGRTRVERRSDVATGAAPARDRARTKIVHSL